MVQSKMTESVTIFHHLFRGKRSSIQGLYTFLDRMCESRIRDGMTAWEFISHESDRLMSGFIWTNTKIFKISQVWKMHNSSFEWISSLNKYCFVQT